jgi:hypothetical protein
MGVTRWFTHIGKERLEAMPFLADFYASSSIVMEM